MNDTYEYVLILITNTSMALFNNASLEITIQTCLPSVVEIVNCSEYATL